jgi:hypothetical protein
VPCLDASQQLGQAIATMVWLGSSETANPGLPSPSCLTGSQKECQGGIGGRHLDTEKDK